MTDMITLRGIGKRFGKTEVLRDLDLTVERGTVFALLGPNGAGKTTIINILSTLIAPDIGHRDGRRVRRRAPARAGEAQHQRDRPVGRRSTRCSPARRTCA